MISNTLLAILGLLLLFGVVYGLDAVASAIDRLTKVVEQPQPVVTAKEIAEVRKRQPLPPSRTGWQNVRDRLENAELKETSDASR